MARCRRVLQEPPHVRQRLVALSIRWITALVSGQDLSERAHFRSPSEAGLGLGGSLRGRVLMLVVVAFALVASGGGGAAQSEAGLVPLQHSRPVASMPPGGGWQSASYQVAGLRRVLVTTREANGSTAYVAWIDHRTTQLALYPGLQEPAVAAPRGVGEVPYGQRWRLLATFNGGFKSVAGAGGFVVNGRVDEPMQPGEGTLVEYRDGSLAILNWEGRTRPGSLVLARQNLPPLVWAGQPTARAHNTFLWGATLGGGGAVWRSAIGINEHGDLLYAAAPAQTAISLATLMAGLGAVRAIELDINPEWPSFIGYARRGGRDPIKLVPNPQQSAYRYLTPDNRDFFAVYTKAGGGPLVPFH
jgi:hypothetical protein